MRATPQDTATYCASHPLPSPAVRLGKTGLTVSPWGFGGYRISPAMPEHREALRLALRSGCNLIDTSANYTDGGSETLIGEVISELTVSGDVKREELVVVTKAGYLQGRNLKIAREREAEGRPFPEVVKHSEGLWHCISPEFLEDQITRSLERLRLQTIDVFLLHNPEYFLKVDDRHDEYYRRIREAFRHLEKEADRGRIGWYGISSNSFPDPRESAEYTSLETVLDLAHEVSAQSRFAVIQFPFNLFEPGAAFETNNTGKTLAELAASRKIGTLINRPLNAFAQDRLIRLADVQPAHGAGDPREAFEEALKDAIEIESAIPDAIGTDEDLARELRWAHVIYRNLDQILDLPTWNDLYQGRILPRIVPALAQARARDREWTERYSSATGQLFDAAKELLSRQDRVFQLELRNAMTRAAPPLADSPTLSRRVLRIYRSIPGLDCILIGMRRNDYVRDILATERPFLVELALDAMEAARNVAPPLR